MTRIFEDLRRLYIRAFPGIVCPFSPSHAFWKSRMGHHFINRRFQPTVLGCTRDQVPQGRHFPAVCALRWRENPRRNFPILRRGAYTATPFQKGTSVSSLRDLVRRLPCRRLKPTVNKVPSLRDLVRRLPCRRLKPTVNKVSSLRDWAHCSRKCSRGHRMTRINAKKPFMHIRIIR